MFVDVILTLGAALLGCFLVLRWLMACGLGLPIEDSFFDLRQRQEAAVSPRQKSLRRRETAEIFFTAFTYRLMIFLLSGLILLFLSNEWPNLAESWLLGDSVHYVNLVEKGYSGYVEDGQHLFLVFFPLYVWITRIVAFFIGDTVYAGLLVSFVCYSAACVYLYRLAYLEMNRRAAQRTVVYLSVFPFSFFFGGMMTESLFLLTTAAALYEIRRHHWWTAGIWGMMAAMTRMHGVLLIVAAGAELMESQQFLARDGRSFCQRLAPVLRRLVPVLLPLAGTGVYLGLNWWVDGDPFAFVTHQEHWSQGFSWFSQTLGYVGYNAFYWEDLSGRAAIWIPQLLLFALFLAALALCWRRFPAMYTLYAFFYLFLNYSLSWLLSGGRYLACGVPFFLFAAALTEKRPTLDRGLTAAMSALMGVYLFAWLSGASIY